MLCEWHDIFEIVSKDIKGRTYYVPRFKHNGALLHDLLCSHSIKNAESVAFNWINNKNNEKEILNIITETVILVGE